MHEDDPVGLAQDEPVAGFELGLRPALGDNRTPGVQRETRVAALALAESLENYKALKDDFMRAQAETLLNRRRATDDVSTGPN